MRCMSRPRCTEHEPRQRQVVSLGWEDRGRPGGPRKPEPPGKERDLSVNTLSKLQRPLEVPAWISCWLLLCTYVWETCLSLGGRSRGRSKRNSSQGLSSVSYRLRSKQSQRRTLKQHQVEYSEAYCIASVVGKI